MLGLPEERNGAIRRDDRRDDRFDRRDDRREVPPDEVIVYTLFFSFCQPLGLLGCYLQAYAEDDHRDRGRPSRFARCAVHYKMYTHNLFTFACASEERWPMM